MKKIITSLTTAAILSTGLFASGSVQIGGSSNDIGSSNTTNGGFYLGFDTVSVGSNGLLFGADFNVNIFRVSNTNAYTMAVDFLAGYTFEKSFDVPLMLKAGVGYGVTHDYQTSHNSWNPQYNLSMEYTLYKGVGLGAKYNTEKVDLLGAKDITIDSGIGYLYFTW